MKALVKGRRWQSALKLFEEAMLNRTTVEPMLENLQLCGKCPRYQWEFQDPKMEVR